MQGEAAGYPMSKPLSPSFRKILDKLRAEYGDKKQSPETATAIIRSIDDKGIPAKKLDD